MSEIWVTNVYNQAGDGSPNFPNGLTGTAATFTGAVSVGGTLTYEDVTNIDAVGVITARDGLKVTGGNLNVGTAITVYGSIGVVSATSFKGDGSQLTGIDATAIQTGNTSVQTVDTGSDGHVKMTTEGGERVRVGPAGQIGLGGANYGTSGQVLKSGGSAAAPTWGDAGGAGEFEATADGAISAGNPIILTANGKVQKVEETTTYTNPITSQNSAYIKEGHSQNNCFVSMPYSNGDGSSGKPGGVCFYNHGGAGDIQYYRPFKYESGSISFTGNVNYRGQYNRPICSHYNDTSKRGVLFYNNSGNTASCNVIQADDIDGGTVTLHGGGNAIENSYNVQQGFSCHDPSIDRDYLFGWRSGNNARLAIGKLTINSGSWGSSLDAGVTVKDQYMCIAAGGGKVMISYKRSDNNNICVKAGTWVEGSPTPANDSITWGSELEITSNAGTFNALVYDRTAERFILAYCPDSASGKAAVISLSGNTCTKEAEVEFDSQEAKHIALAYSPTIKRSVVAWVDKDDTYKARVQSLSVSGNTVSLVSTPLMFNNNSTYNYGYMGGDNYGVLQLMDNIGCNRMFCGILEGGSGDNSRLHAFEVGTVTGNVNTANFIGFNKTTVADGETAKVQTIASVLTGQSGLTTTSPYFLQRSGAIGLSTDTTIGTIKVGVGIATDKLLIKGF